ncbi:hypothetical protein I302_105122 [Kwoniella bestiolae CBS 10118]|uniref:Xylanolytic transcriptional activator regulatory domain-containing protein n=1 Tax=Kwoniella bestiolae CBS 10118 TaxID=1296100 RepID=A0AAJ8K8G7_9TREE
MFDGLERRSTIDTLSSVRQSREKDSIYLFRRRRRPSSIDDPGVDETLPQDAGSVEAVATATGETVLTENMDTSWTEEMPTDFSPSRSDRGLSSSSVSDLLPPHAEVIEGVRVFLYNYFQLGFLPRAFFLEQVEKDVSSVPVFLLLSILTLSARFTPSLIKRFGGGRKASSELRRRAMSLLGDEMVAASVERMQALFLLGVSEFGEGNGGRSWLLTGMAIRMAATMRLNREATYDLPAGASPEDAIRSEMTRRSFWLIYCHDQQVAGRSPSTTFPLSSIDVLLPCEEEDFIFGQTPTTGRSALPGSLADRSSLDYATEPHRSLFATMIIGQWLWARTAEHASGMLNPRRVRPWNETESFWKLNRELELWELNLPARQTFSPFTGFLSIPMLLRLSHIVLRRAYLPWMANAVDESSTKIIDSEAPPNFWQGMALHMVQNCINLHQVIQTGLATRSMKGGFPAVFIFGVYMCGDIAYYLNRWPKLCPKHAHHAPTMLQSALEVLEQLEEAWPLASRWRSMLAQLVQSTNLDISFGNAARASRNADKETGIYREPSSSPASSTLRPGSLPATSPAVVSQHVNAPVVNPNLNVQRDSQSAVPIAGNDLQTPGLLNSENGSTPLQFDLSSFDTLNADIFAEANGASQIAGSMPYGGIDAFGADLTAFLRGEAIDWSNPGSQMGDPAYTGEQQQEGQIGMGMSSAAFDLADLFESNTSSY